MSEDDKSVKKIIEQKSEVERTRDQGWNTCCLTVAGASTGKRLHLSTGTEKVQG